MMYKDEVLKQAIEGSGYYEFKNVAFDFGNEEMNYKDQICIVLARALVKFRPDLVEEKNRDIVYLICDNDRYGLPEMDLTELLEREPPYDGAEIVTYSLSERKILRCLYEGDGTKWVLCDEDKK